MFRLWDKSGNPSSVFESPFPENPTTVTCSNKTIKFKQKSHPIFEMPLSHVVITNAILFLFLFNWAHYYPGSLTLFDSFFGFSDIEKKLFCQAFSDNRTGDWTHKF